MEQPPEVVAWICEVRRSSRRDAAGVDAAEDAVEAGREDVRNGRVLQIKVGFCHAAYSVADVKPRSPCTTMSSATQRPAGPSPAGRTAVATSSCGTRASRGLLPALGPRATPRLRLAAFRTAEDPDDADALARATAVAAGVALGL